MPLNLVGDFGGGSMFLVTGVLAALWERQRSGAGQVVDAAMVDGASVLLQMMWAFRGAGAWTDDRAANLLDGGAPFYDTYTCADGRLDRGRRAGAASSTRSSWPAWGSPARTCPSRWTAPAGPGCGPASPR